MQRLYLVVLIILAFSNAQAQNLFFETTFGSAGSDLARSVKQLPDGTIFVAGFSNGGTYGGYDIALSRLDRYGNLKWTKYYGDAYDNYGLYLNVCSDGNLVITGEQQSASDGVDIFAYKLDTAGSVIWQNIYSTPLNESGKYIEQTPDGFIICGFRTDSTSSNDIYLLKTDALGGFVWDETYGGAGTDYADMVHRLANGDYLVTGDTQSSGAGGTDVYILRVDSAGGIVWAYTYGDSLQNGCQGILQTSSGHFLSYGETEIYPGSYFDFYLELIDSSGNSIWRETMGGINADAAFSAVETPDGFMLAGYSNSYAPGPLNLVVFKTDLSGDLQWARTYGGPGIDIGYEIIHSVDNGFIVTGKTYKETNDDFYLLHLNEEGWAALPPSPRDTPGISIYPNPARNLFTISMGTGEEKGILSIFSMNGRAVYTNDLTDGEQQIPADGLNPGMYIVEVVINTKVYRQKLVIMP